MPAEYQANFVSPLANTNMKAGLGWSQLQKFAFLDSLQVRESGKRVPLGKMAVTMELNGKTEVKIGIQDRL